jgi:hypothetical protein
MDKLGRTLIAVSFNDFIVLPPVSETDFGNINQHEIPRTPQAHGIVDDLDVNDLAKRRVKVGAFFRQAPDDRVVRFNVGVARCATIGHVDDTTNINVIFLYVLEAGAKTGTAAAYGLEVQGNVILSDALLMLVSTVNVYQVAFYLLVFS